MNSEVRNERIKEIFKEDLKLLLRKGHDYAGDGDCMQNLRDFGFNGIVVRIGDKYHRLKTFSQQQKLQVPDETVIDTLRDLRNYAFLAQILYEDGNIDSSVLEEMVTHYEQSVSDIKLALDPRRCYYCGKVLNDGDICMEIEDGHICHIKCRANTRIKK